MAIVRLKAWDTESRLSRGGKSIVTFDYWTNFNKKRAMSGEFEVLDKPTELYWWFQTNLTPQDIEEMSPQALNRFLYQMYEHYKKIDEKDA